MASRTLTASVVLVLICTAWAGAGVIGYDYTTMTNQPGGSSFSAGVGHRFIPTAEMEVTSLGFAAWEGTNTGIFPSGAPPVTVQLYDYDTAVPDNSTLLATSVFSAGTPSVLTFDPGPPGSYVAHEWRDALAAAVPLQAGEDYMVVAYGFSNNPGNQVQYLNGPTGVTVASDLIHDNSYWNNTGRGVGDAPDVRDGVQLQYAGPTFEYDRTGAPQPFIIDNGDPGYTTFAFTEQGNMGDAFSNDQAWNNAGGASVASYLFTGLESRLYEVFATWRQNGQGNVGNAFFTISDGGGLSVVDQRVGPANDVQLLDGRGIRMNFEYLSTALVLDGDLQIDLRGPAAGGFVLADAIAVRPLIPEPATVLLLALGALGLRRRKR